MTQYASRKARKAATRAELKSAALGRFAEFGVADTSIAMITQAAGVAHGTFYVHFSSKDELVSEFACDFNQGLLQVWQPMVMHAEQALPTLLHGLCDAYFQYWSQRRQFVAVYLHRYAFGTPLERGGTNRAGSVGAWLEQGLSRAAHVLGGTQPEVAVVRHALCQIWLRTGLQLLRSGASERESARRTLVAMTCGALEAALPGVSSLSPHQIRALAGTVG
ncbi:MAG TPA: TetR/AcrR family transcriptional regulator [Sorangium sp.]|nr:TetR/AcrR family transcriptional regulator [Sorangium sp.]